jgi:hypothetical protein
VAVIRSAAVGVAVGPAAATGVGVERGSVASALGLGRGEQAEPMSPATAMALSSPRCVTVRAYPFRSRPVRRVTRAGTVPVQILFVIQGYRLYVNRELPPFERGCSSKVPYGTRGEAKGANRGRRHDGTLKPYHCQFFDHWHLGHPRHGHA